MNCELCGGESKYSCPRCKCKTCSLACFNKHKDVKSCSGKSDTTLGTRDSYIEKKELDGNDVQRDYNFLLKMNRNLDIAKDKKREMKIMKRSNNSNHNQHEWMLQRGVKVRKVPFGMSRGVLNKSGKKGKEWSWTIEFVKMYGDKAIAKSVRYKCFESSKVCDILPTEWDISDEDSLWMKDCETGKIKLLNREDKLCDVLAGVAVIEFPTLYLGAKPNDDSGSGSGSGSDNNNDSDSDGDTDSESSSSNSSDGSDSESSNSDGPPEEESAKIPVTKK